MTTAVAAATTQRALSTEHTSILFCITKPNNNNNNITYYTYNVLLYLTLGSWDGECGVHTIFSVCNVNLCALSIPRIDMYYGWIYCSTFRLGSVDFISIFFFRRIQGLGSKVEEESVVSRISLLSN